MDNDLLRRAAKAMLNIPQIRRGKVWCMHCGAYRLVDASRSLQHGWPKCCGYTMTIDSPEERERFRAAAAMIEGK
ncbi:hypothetical protein CAL26_09800 [Bordetella genomosp. 9]|uniref:Uncharacterized protein n=1 Tax=Bordetella genomosp. 9 TaxID=1416803 RepID=A0A261RFI4_9BORD|nr:hypothetical protein [Bordetella genomosp. 9]OZI23715.1 hypothetical protein CAL26_09800 [Bordetella genomosp. 9]